MNVVFVEALDKCFENVCELDLIFHSDKVQITRDMLYAGYFDPERHLFIVFARIFRKETKLNILPFLPFPFTRSSIPFFLSR